VDGLVERIGARLIHRSIEALRSDAGRPVQGQLVVLELP